MSASAEDESAFVFVQRFGETEAEQPHCWTGIDGDREWPMDPDFRVQGLDHQGWLEPPSRARQWMIGRVDGDSPAFSDQSESAAAAANPKE